MVLILDNKLQSNFPISTRELFKIFPIYKKSAKNFSTQENKLIDSKGLLYIGQQEFAATVPNDKNVRILGSEGATSCIIIIVRHSGSGATALTHYDGTDGIVPLILNRVQELSREHSEGRYEFQLIGGYSDELNYSEGNFYQIMKDFHLHNLELHLTLSCVGESNTTFQRGIPSPCIYGVGVDVRTGITFPANFNDRGPDVELRHASLYADEKLMEIYNHETGILKIGPFRYRIPRDIHFYLEQDDDFLLANFSTSPLVEPPYFVDEIKRTFTFMLQNPEPLKTVFRGNQPHLFKRDDNLIWVPCE